MKRLNEMLNNIDRKNYRSILLKTTIASIVLLGNLHCNPASGKKSGLSADYSYKGNITYSLAHPVTGSDSKFQLLMSTPKGVDSMVICQEKNPTLCDSDSKGYAEALSLDVNKPRNYFLVKSDVALASGIVLTLVGLDKDGKAIDYRVLQVSEKSSKNNGGGPIPSGGSGGGVDNGQSNKTYRSAAGQVGTYRMRTPANYDEKKPYRAVIYFHGDGNSNYDKLFSREGNSSMNGWADENDALLISLRTPDQSTRSWSRTDPQSTSNGTYAQAYLQDFLLKKYNIDQRHTYFVGQSGGGIFLSAYFIPTYQDSYRGGALMLCGGEPIKDAAFRPSETAKKTFQTYFHSTTDDFLLRNIRATIDLYSSLGYNVEKDLSGGGEHCAFNQHPIIKAKVSAMIAVNEKASASDSSDVSIDVSIGGSGNSGSSADDDTDAASGSDQDSSSDEDATGSDDPDPDLSGAPGPGVGGGGW